jgi:putative transcriptional regulator
MTEMKSLQNHFLVAMPSLDDPYFSRSLIYVCEHNAEGAMGIVVNQPSTMNVKQLLEQTDKDLTVSDDKAEQIVLAGGPVNQERGFVLHSPQYIVKDTSQDAEQKSWASSLKLAPNVATQAGPQASLKRKCRKTRG